MTWDIRYNRDAEDHLELHATAEGAIEAACSLLDQGCDVYGVWTGDLAESIDREQIIRIHGLRIKSPANPRSMSNIFLKETPQKSRPAANDRRPTRTLR
jgi:hypothetical protein